jgi:hypothetical protein
MCEIFVYIAWVGKRRKQGDGEGGAVAKTLVVDGWWLLVNERSVA